MTQQKRNNILRRGDVTNRTGIPKSSLYALIAEQKFPKPIPLSSRSVGWLEEEVDDWIEKRIAARRPAA